MTKLARYTYDTEFLDDGMTIDLISFGGVCLGDGRVYYAVNLDVDWERVVHNRWLRDNVVPHLPLIKGTEDLEFPILDWGSPLVKLKETIAREVKQFLTADGNDPTARNVRELWAYFASYDHVALAQLWGPMMNLPSGIPMFTRDIKDWCVRLGDPSLPAQMGGEHSAFADAQHNAVVMRYLDDLERSYSPALITLP